LWCLCPRKKQFANIKHARINSTNDKESLEDPFMGFGFGVYGYFNFIIIMIFAYAFLSLLAVPQLMIYKNAMGIEDLTWAEYSLGSLSSSQAACFQAPIKNQRIYA
jgi:hypothetical protein